MLPASNWLESELQQAILEILERWDEPGQLPASLQQLHLIQRVLQHGKTDSDIAHQLLAHAMQHLVQTHPEDVSLLQRRYQKSETVADLARATHVAESSLYRKLNSARQRLAQVIRRLELQARSERATELLQRLEAISQTPLVGIDEHLQQLVEMMSIPSPPWILAIEALGGTGKTALADALARSLIELGRVYDLAWIIAKQNIFNAGGALDVSEVPAFHGDTLIDALCLHVLGPQAATLAQRERLSLLTQRLKQHPHLIFLDNLENDADVRSVLPILRRLINPSRFVLTTRRSLYDEADIFHYNLPELSEPNALKLIRNEATIRNLPEAVQASDADLRPIFATVGGNPLALRLVVGQLHIHALEAILDDLQSAHSNMAATLYTHIYRRAWDHLSELERKTLLMMPMVDETGGTLEMLTAISRLQVGDLQQALSRLVTYNLVESRGGLHQRRYTIHSLTRSFLHRQVARWE